MALLIETIRNRIVSSIRGRALGLLQSGAIGGFTGPVMPIEDVTSTAGTTITNFGQTNFLTSGSSQLGVHTLQQIDQVGITKTIALISTSTGNQIVKPNNAVIWTSSGATGSTVINLKGAGANITLRAISTGMWQQIGATNSLVTFTTST